MAQDLGSKADGEFLDNFLVGMTQRTDRVARTDGKDED